MPNNSRETTEEKANFRSELLKQLTTLSASGFGLVAALAWNNLIQELVSTYVKRWIHTDGKLISLFIYALIVTILAVIVTYQLSKLSGKSKK